MTRMIRVRPMNCESKAPCALIARSNAGWRKSIGPLFDMRLRNHLPMGSRERLWVVEEVLTAMKAHRLERVAEVIREVASETILFELRDPRVKGVTVTRTEVSADLQHAKVFVSIMGSESEQKLCMYGLRNAAGFVQAKLAKRLETRFTPLLTFVLDH